MKKIVFLVWLLLSGWAQAAFWAGTDIPLLDDLVINENEGFSFDTPAGQIMTLVGKTKMSVSKIKEFYKDSLGALGWQQKSNGVYRRDQDEFVIQAVPSGNGYTTVKMQLTFANK